MEEIKSRMLEYENKVIKNDAGVPITGLFYISEPYDPEIGPQYIQCHFKDGLLHSPEGPAVFFSSGQQEEWLEGKFVRIFLPDYHLRNQGAEE